MGRRDGEGQGHGHGHGHGHDHSHDYTGTAVPRLAFAFGLTALILIAEIVGGVLANSLALLADAAHMAGDTAGLAVALLAAWIGRRPATRVASYGFRRAEVLAAMGNALLVAGAGAWILYEAVQRWSEPAEVASGAVIIVAFIGLAANLAAAAVLAGGRKENLNIRAALLHVLIDALGSVGVLVSAFVIRYTGFQRADTVMAVVIAFLVIPQAWRLIKSASAILLELAPPTVDSSELETWMRGRPGVVDVHDLHVWSIHGNDAVLTAHVVVADGLSLDDGCAILCDLEEGLHDRFGVGHATLQIESTAHRAHELPRKV